MTVFNTWAARERALTAAAHSLASAMDTLLTQLASQPSAAPDTSSGSGNAVTGALAAFDAAWAQYLALFAAWKGHDAAALEVRPQPLRVRQQGLACLQTCASV